MEQCADETFTKEDLQDLSNRVPKAYQYDRAVRLVLLNYTTGLAHGRIKYGVECGLDAWRKLYNRYIPLAEDLRNILIRELMAIKPVAEADVDNLFAEIERITEQYMRAGEAEPMQERWVKAAIMQNLPNQLVTNLSMPLKAAKTVEDMQSIINVYLHDHKTGLPKGQQGPMLCLAEDETAPTYAAVVATNVKTDIIKDKEAAKEQEEGDLDAVKGNRKDKGKGKGYGQCWHCGQMGHPRRKCPEWFKLQGGNVAALKGADWNNYKGKGKKGKGKKGQGKGKGWGKVWQVVGQGYRQKFNLLGHGGLS